jgi:two-component system, cell cycle response regulator DivK
MATRSLSLLLVEDGATYSRLATYLLQGLGHRVILAETAEAGLELARQAPPDLILMDLNLPGMDGYTAAAVIRGDPALTAIPTIALTAERLDAPADPRMVAFTAMVEKPIYAETFRELLAPYAETG